MPPDCPQIQNDGTDIVVVEVGDFIPFDGQLFTHDAAACLLVELEGCTEQAQAELSRRDQLCAVRAQAMAQDCDAQLAARQEEITILEDSLAEALTEKWYESRIFYVVVGFVGGAAIGYVIGDLL